MNRLDELTLKLLDRTISDDEVKELAELSAEGEGRESLRRLMELESHLHLSGQSSVADRVLDQIQQERCDRVEESVMRAVTESGSFAQAGTHDSTPNYKSRVAITVIGIAIAACLLFVFFRGEQKDDRDSVIAVLNRHGSAASVLDVEGSDRSLGGPDQPLDLRSSDTIETFHAIDTAEIVYADGTKVELLGETKVRISESPNGAKQIQVLTGLIQADVTPQPSGMPLRIVTESATLEVLGTTLGVEVRDDSTQLGVATGRVAMTRKADGQRVEVQAGRFATATESTSEPLQSHPFPTLPREWSEDFEKGLPSGWRSGERVELLDAVAVKAIRSMRTKEDRFVLTSQNAWQEGDHALCAIDQDSVLHLRIRQSAFARITIMVGTRSYPPATGRTGGNLFYTKKAWNEDLPADTWKTISIPLKDIGWQIKQGKRSSGPFQWQGLAAYLIHVSTMEQDSGLMIDRIWITHPTEERSL